MSRFSLRHQLALLGLVAAVAPLLVLFGVVISTSSSEEIQLDPKSGAEVIINSEPDGGVASAVVVAALILVILASSAVWWWSGRAVRPMNSITCVADEIQGASLDRRIGMHGQAVEVQALADSFDRMLDRVEDASTTQQRLIEDASHELRTPLTALAVNNEVMLREASPTIDDFRASAQRSEALIERLQVTIDDLLSDARGAHQKARQVDNDLVAIARRVADQHHALNAEISVVVSGPDELLLGIDGPSVHRAVSNLVENAARFSPVGSSVEVVITPGTEHARPTLSVTDCGPGIPEAEISRVFDRYYQADSSADRGGTGIGLALVKQVADAHGSIAVESPPVGRDAGTRFTILFS